MEMGKAVGGVDKAHEGIWVFQIVEYQFWRRQVHGIVEWTFSKCSY